VPKRIRLLRRGLKGRGLHLGAPDGSLGRVAWIFNHDGRRLGSLWGELAVEERRRDTFAHEEVAAGDQRAFRPHEQGTNRSDLVGRAAATRGAQLDHALVSLTTRAGQLVPGEQSEDDAGTDRVDPGTSPTPPDGLGHDSQRVPPLGQLVGLNSPCRIE